MDLVNWPSGLCRNSPQGLDISSFRVYDQIRDPEIPITLRPHMFYIYIIGEEGNWDFWMSDLVKNPDGTDI